MIRHCLTLTMEGGFALVVRYFLPPRYTGSRNASSFRLPAAGGDGAATAVPSNTTMEFHTTSAAGAPGATCT